MCCAPRAGGHPEYVAEKRGQPKPKSVGTKATERFQKVLFGGIPTSLKNMKVNWDHYSQYIWKNKKCSKPPTR
jgi:hypothetical protein